MKTKFILGFVFNRNFSKVLLIHKNRPEWQKGKVNGIGGHLEVGEAPLQGIVREVWEESNLKINSRLWRHVLHLEWKEGEMDVFTVRYKNDEKNIQSMTDEVVQWHECVNLPQNIIPNLKWMIPLSMNALVEEKDLGKIDVHYI